MRRLNEALNLFDQQLEVGYLITEDGTSEEYVVNDYILLFSMEMLQNGIIDGTGVTHVKS